MYLSPLLTRRHVTVIQLTVYFHSLHVCLKRNEMSVDV